MTIHAYVHRHQRSREPRVAKCQSVVIFTCVNSLTILTHHASHRHICMLGLHVRFRQSQPATLTNAHNGEVIAFDEYSGQLDRLVRIIYVIRLRFASSFDVDCLTIKCTCLL